jgi:FkbM family methyltransferase
MDDRHIHKAFAYAAAYPSLPRVKRWLRAPARTTFIKAANVVGSGGRWSMPLRTRTFWGARMRVRIPELVSNELLRDGLFEPGLTAYMLGILKPGDTVLDVGAHYGYFTLLASDLVGAGGEVHAFEPTPSTFAMLRGNVRGRVNVVANQTAVWAAPQEITITDLGPRLSALNTVFAPRLKNGELKRLKATQVAVPAVSLDDYCTGHGLLPILIKVDAESSEHHVLRGMKGLLTSARPFVTLEVGDFDLPDVPRSAELVRSMISHGYVPLEYTDGVLKSHRIQESYRYDNLLFAPSEKASVQLAQP